MRIWAERSAVEVGLAEASRRRRGIALRALEKTWPELAGRAARGVSGAEARAWAARVLRVGTGFVPPGARPRAVARGMSASAFNQVLGVLRGVFGVAGEFGACYDNPGAAVGRVAPARKRLELPSAEEFRAIWETIAGAGARQSRECAWLVRLLGCSGLRIAEARALRWGHVDFAKGVLVVPGTKSESSRRVLPLFPALRELLEEMRAWRVAQGIAVGAEYPVAGVGSCELALTAACKAVGVKRMTHHDLRHLFATRCIESGVDIPTVSRWLGHADGGALAMRTYGHLRQEHSQAQAARVKF